MISNSTPIICLAKINQLELLKKLFNKIIIPEVVKDEILVEGKPGFSIISNAIEKGWILVENPKNNYDFGIGKGENAAINLAKEKQDTLIIDDSYAIKIANSFNIDNFRTTKIIFLALKKNLINKKEAKSFIHKLVQNGYYIKQEIYSKIIEFLYAY